MAVAAKVDLKKDLKELYRPSARQVSLVNVPALNYLMVDGKGDPNDSSEFQNAIEAVYGLAYTLKFACKADGIDFTVMPLEALFWTPRRKSLGADKSTWRWTMMTALPPQVKKSQFNLALKELAAKKSLPSLGKVRFERLREGKSVEMMHIGPYADEGRTIDKMLAWVRDNGFKVDGRLHEIYMSDPRRVAPERLKTIVRFPVARR